MTLQHISTQSKENFSDRQWARLINSLSGFKSANLVGTHCDQGRSNLALVSSVVHLGASPPLMAFVSRPHSEKSPRHTLMNIQSTGVFTLNMVTEETYKRAHQTSARYPREVSEFTAANLEALYREGCHAPFVKESPLQIELELQDIMSISQNKTKLVIGKIKNIYLLPKALQPDGYVDIEGLRATCVSGLDGYHLTQRLSRLSYAKPDKDLEEIPLSGD